MKGSLAVITGASSGLGATFARKLAARGYNLLLIARREARLQSIAREISEQYHVHVEILAADLTNETQLAMVADRIRGAPTWAYWSTTPDSGPWATFSNSIRAVKTRCIDCTCSLPCGSRTRR